MNGRACRSGTGKAGSRNGKSRVKATVPPTEEPMKSCARCKNAFPLKEMKKYTYKKYVEGNWKKFAGYYCKECFDELYVKCDGCEKIVNRDESRYVEDTDETLCDECFEESYDTCEACGGYVSREDSISAGDYTYCPSCAARLLFTCPGCGERFAKDEATLYGGRFYCSECARKSFMSVDADLARKKFSDCDVEREYPGLGERISVVYDLSAWNRSVTARKEAANLKEMLPGVAMDFDSFTYIDESGSKKSLTDIMSPRSRLNKRLALYGDDSRAIGIVNYLQNIKTDVKRLFEERDSAVSMVYDSLKIRMLSEENDPELKKATGSIEGEFYHTVDFHDEKVKYKFLVTKDPVAILAKTTSQCWENMSCEKAIRGEYGHGAFSDISLSNLVCYVFLEKLPVARIMVRWCETEGDKIDFGIEKKWYYCTVRPDEAETFPEMGTSTTSDAVTFFLGGLRAYHATRALVNYLHGKGYFKDYDECTTPYAYGGYSDTMHQGRTSIRYRRNVE